MIKIGFIRKDIVTDSTIAGAVYEPVFITRYQDFKTSAPELNVSISQQMLEGLNGNSIMLLVAQANSEIESWNKKIFGDETKRQGEKIKQKILLLLRRCVTESLDIKAN